MDRETKRRALRAGTLLLGLLAVFALVIFVWQPPCFILQSTGFYCAGCGGQRMLLALLRGDFPSALAQNPFLFFLLPAVGIYLFVEVLLYIRQKSPLYQRPWTRVVLLLLLALALAFTLLRNLPGWEFLGPVL